MRHVVDPGGPMTFSQISGRRGCLLPRSQAASADIKGYVKAPPNPGSVDDVERVAEGPVQLDPLELA